jgi:hypothetical protein
MSPVGKVALAMPGKNWKLQNRLLVREGAPHQQTSNCLKMIKERREKNWSRVPDGCLTPGGTGRLTAGRNITLTLILTLTLTLSSAQLEISGQLQFLPFYPWSKPSVTHCSWICLRAGVTRYRKEKSLVVRGKETRSGVQSAAFTFKAEEYATQYTALGKQQVETSACFMLVSCLAYSSSPRLEATCYSETSVEFQRAARRYIKENISLHPKYGARGSIVVKALCYTPEDCGFDTRWGEFLNLPNMSGRTRP